MRNRFEHRGDAVVVFVRDSKGIEHECLIDSPDLLRVQSSSWSVANCGYVRNGKGYLHRFLMDAAQGMDVDHINHNAMDNRRVNLRVVPHHINLHNLSRRPRNVYFSKAMNRWQVQFCVRRKLEHFGYFDTPEEAAVIAAGVRERLLRGETVQGTHASYQGDQRTYSQRHADYA